MIKTKISRILSSLLHLFLSTPLALSFPALVLAIAAAYGASVHATSLPHPGLALFPSSTSAASPTILTRPDSTRAIAVETVTLKGEPFSPVAAPSFGADNRNRITLFARNLDLMPGENVAAVTADAQDGTSQVYPLTVEYVGSLADSDGISFVVVRLSDQLADVGDVLVRLSLHSLVSNRVRVGVGHIGGGPPDDPSASPSPTPTPGATHLIAGQVMDNNGGGLPGVTVTLANTSGVPLRTALTANGGNFSFDSLASGADFSVTPSPTQFFTFTTIAFTNLSADASAMFTGQQRLYSISGRVTTGSSGLGSVTMTCNDGVTTSGTLTDSNGNYSFALVIAGRNVTITATKAGYVFANGGSANIPNLNGNRTGVDFTASGTPTPSPTPTPTPAQTPRDPNSTGYLYVPFTATLNAGVSVNSGTVTRTASGSGYGAAYAQANQQVAYGTGAIAVQVHSASDVLAFGLTNSGAWSLTPSQISAPSDTSRTGPTFGIYLNGNGGLSQREQESTRYFSQYACNACVQANDWLIVSSDEGLVKYYRDRGGVLTLLFTSDDHNPVKVAYPLLPQISISTNGAQANVKILQPTTWGTGTNTYASTTGTTYGAGTQASPTTLALALSGTRPVQPGDTIWLMDGTYRGLFNLNISGSANSHITVRPLNPSAFPSYNARIAGDTGSYPNGSTPPVIKWNGSYVDLMDIEVTNLSPDRVSHVAGSEPTDIAYTEGIQFAGAGNRIINCSIHDHSSNGITAFNDTGSLIYGTIFYNNGWTGPDRTHGHGIYTHNPQNVGSKLFSNVISFNPYSLAIKTYTAGAGEPIYSEYLDDFSVFNGTIALNSNGQKHDMRVSRSHVYNGSIQIGESIEPNWDVVAEDNVVYGTDPMPVQSWRSVQINRNKLIQRQCASGCGIGRASLLSVLLTTGSRNSNTYWRGLTGGVNQNFAQYTQIGALFSYYSFAGWQLATGYDMASTYYNEPNQSIGTRPSSAYPPYLISNVVPNIYLTGGATIRVWNWGPSGTPTTSVGVNLSTSGLVTGQTFTVVSVQSGRTIFGGTYNSLSPSIALPMSTDGAPLPRVNDAGTTPASTMPEFGVFLVIPGPRP